MRWLAIGGLVAMVELAAGGAIAAGFVEIDA